MMISVNLRIKGNATREGCSRTSNLGAHQQSHYMFLAEI